MKSRRFAIERHRDTVWHSARLNTYSDRERDQYAVELPSPGFWPRRECRLLCSCQLLTLQLEPTMMLISLIRVCVAWWKGQSHTPGVHPSFSWPGVCVYTPTWFGSFWLHWNETDLLQHKLVWPLFFSPVHPHYFCLSSASSPPLLWLVWMEEIQVLCCTLHRCSDQLSCWLDGKFPAVRSFLQYFLLLYNSPTCQAGQRRKNSIRTHTHIKHHPCSDSSALNLMTYDWIKMAGFQ